MLRGLHLLGSRTVILLGLMLAIGTGIGSARNLWFSLAGRTVEGVVVRQLEELSVDWRQRQPEGAPASPRPGIQTGAAQRLYRSVVDFQEGGKPYQVVASARATVHMYPLGSKVDVVFPPGQPERARLRPELPDSWVQAGLLLVATVLGSGCGYLWWQLAVRRASRRRVVNAGS